MRIFLQPLPPAPPPPEPARVAVGIHAWRAYDAGRSELLAETIDSLDAGPGHRFTRDLVTVTSLPDDGTADLVRALGGVVVEEPNNAGRAMNRTIAIAMADQEDLDYVLYTADAIRYGPHWLARLVAFWDAAPADVLLAGGQTALVRDTIPGSCWSFRARDWPRIGPVPEITGGEDLETCRRLTTAGYRLVALDLAEHTGAQRSSWGNTSAAPPLDRARWGL